MFEDLLALMTNSGGSGTAVHLPSERREVSRARLLDDVRGAAGDLAGMRRQVGTASVWVSVGDPYLMLLATLGCLQGGSAALVEPDGPARTFDLLAPVCPPAAVVTGSAASPAARWALARDVRVYVLDPSAGSRPAAPAPAPPEDGTLQFFTSGTTGPAKCVGVGRSQLLAAVRGVARRLELTPADVSLSVAPLTHTLGLVTTVLVALTSGGAVVFADPLRPREFLAAFSTVSATWCAASPSGHRLIHTLVGRARLGWPSLRFLRSSSAPIPGELAGELENYHGAPFVNAYAMTEAPGEIASQGLTETRAPGTVGPPTLCEVEIRSAQGPAPAGGSGEVWIRGPNVVVAAPPPGTPPQGSPPSGPPPWLATGDIGSLDDTGVLRLTGRSHDVINQGGLKIWPPDVEAVALQHPGVRAAVAFPVPHKGLGETVALAVVPRAGQAVDRGAIRSLLMADLPRHTWPSAIIVCSEIPLTPRGKIQRRGLWRRLPGLQQQSQGS